MLVLTGDVTLEEVQRLVHKYFEHLPKSTLPLPARLQVANVPHKAPLVLSMKSEQTKSINLGATHKLEKHLHTQLKENFTLATVVLEILNASQVGVLEKEFVHTKNGLLSCSIVLQPGEDLTTFTIALKGREQHTLEDSQKFLGKIRTSLANLVITPEMLERAKKRILSQVAHLGAKMEDGLEDLIGLWNNQLPLERLKHLDTEIQNLSQKEVEGFIHALVAQPIEVIEVLMPISPEKQNA